MNFSVYHDKNPRFGIAWMGGSAPDEVDLRNFDRVAVVDCEELEDVLE